jgi:Curlin associated repeat
MNDWNEGNLKFVGFVIGLVIVWLLSVIFFISGQAHAQGMIGMNALGMAVPISTSTNSIYIEQVGSYNSVTVNQDGTGHAAVVTMGLTSAVDNTAVAIDQKDSGAKTATVNIPGGFNNSVSILQQGTGNHTASITNLNGIANSVTINQGGAGKHTMEIVGVAGTQNNGNTITALQTGGVGTDKTFNLWLNGWNTNVTIEQTNPTTAGQGGMNISCGNSCGTQPWSYISR